MSTRIKSGAGFPENALVKCCRGADPGTITASLADASTPQSRRLVAGARHVLGVAAAVAVDAFGGEFQEPVRQRRQEVPVVGDEQQQRDGLVRRGALGDL